VQYRVGLLLLRDAPKGRVHVRLDHPRTRSRVDQKLIEDWTSHLLGNLSGTAELIHFGALR
jgi:hypothetical protein